MNITFKEKDAVLSLLCSEVIIPEQTYKLNRLEFIRECGLDSQIVNSILLYFQRIGIVKRVNYQHHSELFIIEILTEAFDLFNRGGFTMQENMLQKEVKKLLLEIERLKPTLGGKIEQVSTIANNIAGIAGNVVRSFVGL